MAVRSPTSLATRKVVLHEAFDGAQTALVLVTELLGKHRLDFEGEALFGAAGDEVEQAPNRPEEVFAAAEGCYLLIREDAHLDAFGADFGAVKILRQPVERVEIAEAALAVLNVGLDLVAALARAAMTLGPLGHLRVDEVSFPNLESHRL